MVINKCQNKKAQLIFLKIMLGIIILIIVMIFAYPLKQSIEISTNTSAQLNCTSSSLDVQQTATCTVLDFSLLYIIGAAISVGMAFIAGKKNINGVITAIVVFVIATVLISPLKTFIIYIRDASHLNCASTALTVAGRLSCILIDLWLFWFFITVISAAATYTIVRRTTVVG